MESNNDWNVEFRAATFDVLFYLPDKVYLKHNVSLNELRDILLSDLQCKIRARDNLTDIVTEYL